MRYSIAHTPKVIRNSILTKVCPTDALGQMNLDMSTMLYYTMRPDIILPFLHLTLL